MKKIGLIPAAGKGSRLGLPFSKELYPVPYRNEYFPIILNNILSLKKIGVLEIVIIINPKKNDILNFLGNGSRWDVKIDYVIQEDAVSLPNALSQAWNLIEGKIVYFLMADTIIEPDDFLSRFEIQLDESYEISLGCFITDNPEKFATLSMENGIVNFIEEKNKYSTNNIMWGFWRWKPDFTPNLFNAVKNYNNFDREQTLSEIITDQVETGKVQGILLNQYKYWDFGTHDEIIKFLKHHG
jgi:glucose-1-phosphate thymidylyltransferase